MKKLFLLLALAGCGSNKMAHPVVVVKHAEVRQAGQTAPQGIVEPGDSVDLLVQYVSSTSGAMVIMRNGKRGFVPLDALALPDSLRGH